MPYAALLAAATTGRLRDLLAHVQREVSWCIGMLGWSGHWTALNGRCPSNVGGVSVYTVCVGVDGTSASRQALRFALDAAARRGGRVRVVTAWWMGDSLPGTVEAEKQIQQRQADAVQQAAVKHVSKQLESSPPVEREIIHDLAGPALVRRSRGDDHLVVGSEHKGALKHLVGGSVSGYCIRHARIPVTVIPYLDPALAELGLPGDNHLEADNVEEPGLG